MKVKRIVVLCGGISSEREVSLKTGRAIYSALLKKGYKAKLMDAKGKWYLKMIKQKPDMVFIALHGSPGEDGKIQGLLEVMGIRYTGSRVLASALAMDKLKSREIFERHNILVPDYIVLRKKDKFKKFPFFPVVVKPVNQGSTIGTSIVFKKKDLNKAIKKGFKFSETLLVEKYIRGREFTVGILGDKALSVMEIVPKNKYYDFESKYVPGMSEHLCPAPIKSSDSEFLKEIALKAHNLLSCRAVSRVDFISDGRKFYLLEINTIPGMTPTSLLPEAAKVDGIEFEELVEKIIKFSL